MKELQTQQIECTNPVCVNVLSEEEFKERAEVVFNTLGEILAKSLGAYGAPTIISEYPYKHVTKDGYTIASNLEFSFMEGEPIDRCIASMARDICFRLNHEVGDGTTSAIVSVNEIYRAFMEMGFNWSDYRPADILDEFERIKGIIADRLMGNANPITPDNIEDIIKKIVHISSNGNDEITDMITEAYNEIRYPSIVVTNSDTDETHMEIIDGYRSEARLSDKVFINSDDRVARHKNVDVIMFGYKVNADTYGNIIRPLSIACRNMRRHLVCMAPMYDDHLLRTTIQKDINDEYQKTGTSALILVSYPAHGPIQKKAIADLAMLLNTSLLGKEQEARIMERIIEQKGDINKIINFSKREIPGIYVIDNYGTVRLSDEIGNIGVEEGDNFEFRLGFADEVELGVTSSVFKCSHYSETLYKAFLDEAKNDLDDVIKKYSGLGTQTGEIYNAQVRYSSLLMKLATIYVGGDTDLAQAMLKDSVNDAVLAAKSAFRFGYVLGCNVSMLGIIVALQDELDRGVPYLNADKELDSAILTVLERGYRAVYRQVLKNAFPNADLVYTKDFVEDLSQYIQLNESIIDELRVFVNANYLTTAKPTRTAKKGMRKFFQELGRAIGEIFSCGISKYVSFYDFIIDYSIYSGKVLDLETMTFTKNVINSAQTDMEILTATIDLLSILITGNQVVMPRIENLR